MKSARLQRNIPSLVQQQKLGPTPLSTLYSAQRVSAVPSFVYGK